MALSASTVQCNASQPVGTPFKSHLDRLILSLSLFFLLAIQFWNSTMKKHSATVPPTPLQLLRNYSHHLSDATPSKFNSVFTVTDLVKC